MRRWISPAGTVEPAEQIRMDDGNERDTTGIGNAISAVPAGLAIRRHSSPGLKRRAIIEYPLRDNCWRISIRDMQRAYARVTFCVWRSLPIPDAIPPR